MSATSAADLVFRLLMIWPVVESLACCQMPCYTSPVGVVRFFLYTAGNVVITVFVTGEDLICD